MGRSGLDGHTVSVSRINDEFILFEGQHNIYFQGYDIDHHLENQKITKFKYYCSAIKNKRPNEETNTIQIRKPKKMKKIKTSSFEKKQKM